MTMGVIAVALALPLFLSLLLQNARTRHRKLERGLRLVGVSGQEGAGSARAQALAKQLRLRGDVAAVRIISAEQALAEFRSDSGFGKALDALTENPLPDTLVVTPTLGAQHAATEPRACKAAIAAHARCADACKSTPNG